MHLCYIKKTPSYYTHLHIRSAEIRKFIVNLHPQPKSSVLFNQSQSLITNKEFWFITKHLNLSQITHWAINYACKHTKSLFWSNQLKFSDQEASITGSNIEIMCNYLHVVGRHSKIDEENVKNKLFALLQSKIISKIASKIGKTISTWKLSGQFEFLPEKMVKLKEIFHHLLNMQKNYRC